MKMKKLILFFIGAAMLQSCQKRSCYSCTTTAYVTVMGQTSTSRSSNTVCDKTEAEIRDIQKQGTTVTTSQGYQQSTVMTCTKQ